MPYRCPAPHPTAVASHGDAAVKWIEARLRADAGTPVTRLRWWQWFVLQRILEVDEHGHWCWPVSFVSVARQLGKSELACELAMWRCANPGLFDGRPQEAAFSANTVTLSRRLQATRWPWALDLGYRVSKLTGNTEIVWPDGSCWRTIAPESFYGRTLDLLLADETWAWMAEDFWQAAWPTSAARPQSHAVLFSTAHDEPKSLVPTIISNDQVCSIVWQAPPDADPMDREVWKQASAFWDSRRERVMEMSADQPSFATQFLNQWPASVTSSSWMPEERWNACRDKGLEVPPQPQIAAVDDRPGGFGAVVAFAWHDGDRVCVTAEQVESLDAAWNLASRAQKVMAGMTLVKEPKARLLRAKGFGTRDLPSSLQAMRIAVMEQSVAWDGDDLARSMNLLEVVEGRDGLRVLTSANGHAAVKVAVVAAREVRQAGDDPVMV